MAAKKLRTTGKLKAPGAQVPAKVFEYASTGCSHFGIARALGIGKELFSTWCEQHPEIQEAYDAGREHERMALHSRVYNTAMSDKGKNGLIAAFFLLKARHGYREGDQSDSAAAVTVNFTLPESFTREQYQAKLIHEVPKS